MGGCPFHDDSGSAESDRRDGGASDDEGDRPPDGGESGRDRDPLGRRVFVKSALLIGGTSALGSLGSVAGITPEVRAAAADPIDAASRDDRQHAWDRYEPLAASGNTAQPPNSLLLLLDYQGVGEPTAAHRRRVETALRGLERQFEWHPNGLLFTVGYSASYFDRYDESPPAGAAPDPQPEVVRTVEALSDLAETNDDVTPDDYDAVLLLSSANASNLLAAEAALWGEDSAESDVSLEETFEGIFEKPAGWPARRVGFAGKEFQKHEQEYEEAFLADGQEVPDEAPLSMGFVAGFGESVPAEEAVTLQRGQRFPGPTVDAESVPTDLDYVGEVGERDPGVFAQGTLKHLSHLEIDLETWYGEAGAADETGSDTESAGDEQRRHQMYSPYHTESETNARGGDKPGSGLTADDDSPADGPGLDEGSDSDGLSVLEYADRTPETAAGDDDDANTVAPTAGHSQKTARARYDVDGDGDPEQPVLRRDWDAITPPTGEKRAAGYIFNVPMRFNESIYSLLDATYNVGFTSLDGRIDHAAASDPAVKGRNGIAPYMTATRRGNWLVPPITVRALPFPRARELPTANLSVSREDGHYVVTVRGLGDSEGLDSETVRLGHPEEVDRARGVSPVAASQGPSAATFEFPTDGTDLSAGDTAKLFGKRERTRKPVVGTTTLE